MPSTAVLDPPRGTPLKVLGWAIVAALATATASLYAASGLGIDVSDGGWRTLAVFVICLLAWLRIGAATDRVGVALRDGIELFVQILAISLLTALASYALMAMSSGYSDASFAAIDAALGLDWGRLYKFTADRPLLQQTGRFAYDSLRYSLLLLIVAGAWSGRTDGVRRFIVAYGIAACVTLAFAPLFPGKSTLIHYGTVITSASYLPVVGIDHFSQIEALRDGSLVAVPLGNLIGLITFPSFHASAAILFIWAFWPIGTLRWPMLALNLAMLAATPVEGTHYFADVIAGILVALLGIGLAYALPSATASLRGAAGRGRLAPAAEAGSFGGA